ncbi:hypothetical protein [Tenacibaculum maritimum]|uniref:hypothetical protein n=1 Tax=Tenacibaculum maritimum TaxID=107401 RepID=UPI0012E43788|nr:hypothetical protein [Tenacibaculum maritimum]CAA0156230.1 conserved hypothetical protein [Tenacibaculum maritimum]CAA0238306.1 conserved hypothetical protein [Tenacibaculum maritimum]
MCKDEREIARKAEQMLEASLRSKTSGFRDHLRRENEVSLKDATAKAKVKKYGLVRNGTAKYYMRSLAIKMARHGFIQNYGIDTIREGAERTRKTPKETTYSFKHHRMDMNPTPFIDSAVDDSGVVPFVLNSVAKVRSEDLLLDIIRMVED